jgi:hypothetical protein
MSRIADLKISKVILRSLKSLASLSEPVQCTIKVDLGPPDLPTFSNPGTVTFCGVGVASGLRFEFPIPVSSLVYHAGETAVKFQHLVHAISWTKGEIEYMKDDSMYMAPLELHWDLNGNSGIMLRVRSSSGRSYYAAVIAPTE